MGFKGQIAWMLISSTIGACSAFYAIQYGLESGSIKMPTQIPLSAQQQHYIQLGENLENKFGGFTPKEQEKINKVITR